MCVLKKITFFGLQVIFGGSQRTNFTCWHVANVGMSEFFQSSESFSAVQRACGLTVLLKCAITFPAVRNMSVRHCLLA